ncbi:hypothetical protein [Nannocystis pusilla]|uniref:hypothetical protein n=1 Tax=Nannocystis pusilla TaxID=889268 RepID=UPI003B82441E
MLRIVDVFAVYERDVIRGRTRAAMTAKRERGERVSRFAPYGSELGQGGDLVPAPAELLALRLAGELAAAGVPLRRIGAELERAGHRPRGRAWAPRNGRLMPRPGPGPRPRSQGRAVGARRQRRRAAASGPGAPGMPRRRC